MADDRRLDGIDVARYQDGPHGPRPDWNAVIADPRIRFIAIKATQGVSYVDPEFKANWADLRRLVPHPHGAPHAPWLAVYHFKDRYQVVDEAEHFYRTVGPLRPGEGVVLDCEGATAGTHADQRAICAVAGRMFDRVAIRYGNDVAWDFVPFVKWTARYRAAKPIHACSLWQWGGANVPGINGAVDANRIMDEADLARAFRPVSEGDGDLTPEESKQLAELHSLLIKGAPAYGVVSTPPEVSRIGRMVRALAAKAGVPVE